MAMLSCNGYGDDASAYSAISTFTRTVPFDDARFSIMASAFMKLVLDAHGVHTDQETHDGKTVYRWHYSAAAVPIDPASLVPIDRVPRVFVSSIPDWDAFGHIWATLIADKAAVTPPIQALADKLTAGISNRREQAKRLYDWVGANIRWVAIQTGNGRIVPHTAGEVLSNGYGDCKDQVMLLIALIRAKGLPAEPVLINLGNSCTLPGAAVVGAFTHCITYLPEWGIYADTTVGGAPFGTLPFQDYGKPVVHAVGATR
jgi:transglutaminase-like putative cysteine protease